MVDSGKQEAGGETQTNYYYHDNNNYYYYYNYYYNYYSHPSLTSMFLDTTSSLSSSLLPFSFPRPLPFHPPSLPLMMAQKFLAH